MFRNLTDISDKPKEYQEMVAQRLKGLVDQGVKNESKGAPLGTYPALKIPVRKASQEIIKARLKQSNKHTKEVVKSIIVEDVLSSHQVPLPLVSKIAQKTLILVQYPIDPANFESLTNNINLLIPNSLTRLVLKNNNLPDEAVASLF